MQIEFKHEAEGIEKITVTSKGADLKIEEWNGRFIKVTNMRALRNNRKLILLAEGEDSMLKVPGNIPLSIHVLGGDVEAGNCRVREIILNGGDALLDNIKLETAKIMSGDLKVSFGEIDGDVSITANNGDVMLFLGEEFDVDVKFRGINGGLKLIGLNEKEIHGGIFEINASVINGELVIYRGEHEKIEPQRSKLHLNEGSSYIAAGENWAEIRIDEVMISAKKGTVVIDTGSGRHEVTNPDAFNLISKWCKRNN